MSLGGLDVYAVVKGRGQHLLIGKFGLKNQSVSILPFYYFQPMEDHAIKRGIFSTLAAGLCLILSIAMYASHAMAAAGLNYITTPSLTINPDIIQPPVYITPYKPQVCPMTLPAPEVSVIGTENYTANGHKVIRNCFLSHSTSEVKFHFRSPVSA